MTGDWRARRRRRAMGLRRGMAGVVLGFMAVTLAVYSILRVRQIPQPAGLVLTTDEFELPGMPGGASEAEIAALWDGYSAEDQDLLAAAGLGIDELLGLAGSRNLRWIRDLADNKIDVNRYWIRHPKEVLVGEPLGWHAALSWDGLEDEPQLLLPGNFDDDPQQELLLRNRSLSILDSDGSSRGLTGLDDTGLLVIGNWDMDGDGRDELLAHNRSAWINAGSGNPELLTTVLDLSGNSLASLPGTTLPVADSCVDLAGDGRRELLLLDYAGSALPTKLTIYGPGGKPAWQPPQMDGNMLQAIADIDGDGRQELLFTVEDANPALPLQLKACGPMLQPTAVPGLTAQDLDVLPLRALDMDGDGRDEFLVGSRLLDLATGTYLQLEIPQGWPGIVIERSTGVTAHAFNTPAGMRLAALVMESADYFFSDTLVLWDARGRLVYQQHFGEALSNIQVLQDPEGDHIVLQTATRLLLSEAEQP